MRLGACLSLTGRYGRFGRQAAHGLRVWQQFAGQDVELQLEDDASDVLAEPRAALLTEHQWRQAQRLG